MLHHRFVMLTLSTLLFLLSGCGTETPTEPENRRAKSGLSLFNHMKTFTIRHEHLSESEAAFVAYRYDLFVGNGERIAEIRAINPDILMLAYMTVRANGVETFGAGCTIHDLCAEPFASQEGYDVENFFVHYQEDVSYNFTFPVGGWMTVSVPGWNPGREGGDPPATAASLSESRVWGAWDYQQRWANIADPGWQHWTSERIVALTEYGGLELDGVLIDGIARNVGEMAWMQFDKTREYAGETVDNGFSMIDDGYSFIVYLRDYLSGTYGSLKIIAGNATHPWYLVTEAANSPRLLERFEWFLLENGVQIDNSAVPATCSYEVTWPQLMAVKGLAKEGKKILFGGKDNTWSDRGRLFVLSVFYLINHTNMYYTQQGPGLVWHEVMSYELGAPEGEPYLWGSGTDPMAPANTFHIMARDYGNALVLVKFRHEDSVVMWSLSNTTHALGGNYRALDIDGTPGAVITEVTLRNNEAAILIPESR